MTIYILGTPEETAQALDDKSLDKMIKSIAHALCNICYWSARYGQYTPYERSSYYKDDVPLKPKGGDIFKWSDWARECRANYLELVTLGLVCCTEYAIRFTPDKDISAYAALTKCKSHKLYSVIEWAAHNCDAKEIYSSGLTQLC